MTLIGIHHVGLAVHDVSAACGAFGLHGFVGDSWFEVSGPDCARGNGLDSLTMRVAFVSDGVRTIEVIEPVEGCAGSPPQGGDAGHQAWSILSPEALRADETGVDLLPRVDADLGYGIDLVTSDTAATVELLSALGLRVMSRTALACPSARIDVVAATTGREAPPPDRVGRSHLAFRVDDAARAHRDLSELGFDCVSEPIAHGDSINWFFVKDPGGSGQFELIEDRD